MGAQLYYLIQVAVNDAKDIPDRDATVMEHLARTDFRQAKVIRVPIGAISPDLLAELNSD
jgi:hypothetical protein